MMYGRFAEESARLRRRGIGAVVVAVFLIVVCVALAAYQEIQHPCEETRCFHGFANGQPVNVCECVRRR